MQWRRGMRWVLPLVLAIVGVSSTASNAAAEERITTPTSAPAETRLAWYGYQPLVVDVGAIALMGASIEIAGKPGFLVGYGAWLTAAPVVHALHGRWVAAAASLTLRAVLPIVMQQPFGRDCGAEVHPAYSDAREDCEVDASTKGILIGAGAAMLIDAVAFSWESKPVTTVPTLSASRNGFTIGLSAVF